jgi:hypothetical protein
VTREEPICCMVIAPCSPEAIQDAAFRLARKHSIVTKRDYLRETDWKTARGTAHGGLYTRVPGSEGGDRNIADIVSRDLGDVPVYTVQFDLELEAVFEFRRGKVVAEIRRAAKTFVYELGFRLFPDEPAPEPEENFTWQFIVVEGTTADELRGAVDRELILDAELEFDRAASGALVHCDGRLLTGVWQSIAEAVPSRTVYYIVRDVTRDSDTFSVRVLRDAGTTSREFRDPPHDSSDSLPDILGERTPATILAALGIAPSLLGYDG